MGRGLGFVTTALGRRLFAAFLLAAFFPVSLMALLAYLHVRGQLGEQAREQGRGDAKLAGIATLAALARLRGALANLPPGTPLHLAQSIAGPEVTRLYYLSTAEPPPLSQRRRLTEEELARLRAGEALLLVEAPGTDSRTVASSELWMGVPSSLAPGRVVWAELAPDELWGPVRETLAEGNYSLCVLSYERYLPISCRTRPPVEVLGRLRQLRQDGGRPDLVRWSDGDSSYYSSSWSAFLKHEYGSEDWQLVVSHNAVNVLAPLQQFGTTLGLVALPALLIVFLLSHLQIRRSTEPLAQLHGAAKRIANGDLASAVMVASRDEFADLARSFDTMRKSLSRQFLVLHSLDKLHQSAMAASEFFPVAQSALEQLGSLIPGSLAAIVVAEDGQSALVLGRDNSGGLRWQRSSLRPEGLAVLEAATLASEASGHWQQLFTGILPPGGLRMLFPLRDGNQLQGLLAVQFLRSLDEEERESLRRLCDRLGTALGRLRLLQQLDQMNEGMLKTLARVVDASSHWTAGHSERVTQYSLLIGERLGLTKAQLNTLQRGALLHDLGKVGIPAGILDKADRLTPRERQLVERHAVIGAEILAPLPALADLIPMVRWHHERLDGSGYPDGLRGEAIPLLARIVAVADVFDALVSGRPYRAGLSVESTMATLRAQAGVQLDRAAVEALLAALQGGALEAVAKAKAREGIPKAPLQTTALEVAV
jgi:HAMP domain-containing protein